MIPTAGPLVEFEKNRGTFLNRVCERTLKEVAFEDPEVVLAETLFLEKIRLKKVRPNLFTKKRLRSDRKVWGQVQAGLMSAKSESDRNQLLKMTVGHFAEEIGGHFDPRVYRFATMAVPFGFSWLLNAASLHRFNPWRMEEKLAQRLRLEGHIEQLVKLSQKGTVLLVPTHQSNIDSVLIGYVIYRMGLPPFAYGAGLNLFTNPVLSFFMSNLGAYTVDRQKNSPLYKAVLKNYSTELLQSGIHSIFFPGGGRCRSGAIESHLKLGLLGTALDAQLYHLQQPSKKPVYIVPMITSYHFVLEASSLIEDYLAMEGRHRFLPLDDDSLIPLRVLNFFWKMFSAESNITVRIGRALDVFGNLVDEDGVAKFGGHAVDPARWLTTRGELCKNPQRDREYVKRLGTSLVDRYYRDHMVLSSHVVAFAFFEALREKYADYDLYRFLRLTGSQRVLHREKVYQKLSIVWEKLKQKEARGEICLSEELTKLSLEAWVKDGMNQLGLFHGSKVVSESEGLVTTDDMSILYYYRNRLSGYGISTLAEKSPFELERGSFDGKGFLV